MLLNVLDSLDSLLNAIDSGVVVTGRDHTVQFMNGAAEQLLGCDRRYLAGASWKELLTEASLPFIEQEAKSLLNLVRTSELETVPCDVQVQLGVKTQDMQLQGFPLYTEDRVMPTGVLWRVSLRDHVDEVHEVSIDAHPTQDLIKKISEGTFSRSPVSQCMLDIEAAYQLIKDKKLWDTDALAEKVDSDPDFAELLRDAIEVKSVNKALVKMLNARDETHFSQKFTSQLSVDSIKLVSELLVDIMHGKRYQERRGTMDTFDGEKITVSIKAALPSEEALGEGAILSFVAIEKEEDSKTGYLMDDYGWYSLLENIPYYVSVFELKTRRRLYENAPLGCYLGYSRQEVDRYDGDHWYELMHPDERENDSTYRSMFEKMKQGEGYESILRFRHKDGAWHFMQFKSRALEFDEKGSPVTGVGIAQDVTSEMQAQRRLASQEKRYRLLATNMTDIVWTTDEHLKINYVTPSIKKMLGYSAAEVLKVGNSAVFHNEQLLDLEGFLKSQLQAMAVKARRGIDADTLHDYKHTREVPVMHRDGRTVWMEVNASMLITDDNDVQGMLCICRDITARKQIDDDLRLSAKVFQNGLAATVITDPAGIAVQINKAYTRITGFTSDEVLYKKPKLLTETTNQSDLYRSIELSVLEDGYWEGEIIHRRKNGEQYPSWMAISEVKSDEGTPLGYITTFTDITERKISEKRIHKLAYYDVLTGLPNRSLFGDRLDHALQHAIRTQEFVALLFLDLDRFKAINDSMGHAVGDQLLKGAAQRLLDNVRRDDTVARMGGDEFTIILGDLPTRHKAVNAAAHVAAKVMQALGRPFILEDKETFIGTSIGISFYPIDAMDASGLVQKADTAMYHAKAMGKNNYQFYAEAMTESALVSLEIESNLHQALENNEFHLVYQPIITAEDHKTVGVEVLLRWNCRGEKFIPPTDFIPIAEEAGLIVDIGGWVLEKACYQVAEWESQGLAVDRIAVNVSPKQFANGLIIDQVKVALKRSGIKPSQLEVEVTEGVLMGDTEKTLVTLQKLQGMGVSISIDDFGTGYSSLAYLRQFPINNLKIDRSFIQGVPGHEQDESLVEAIVAMAHALHLRVIAEGVEGAAQFEFVKSLGCEEVQGYFLGRPQPEDEVTQHLRVVKKYARKRRPK